MKRVHEKALVLMGLVAFLGACGGDSGSAVSVQPEASRCLSSELVERSKPDSLYERTGTSNLIFDTRTGLTWNNCLLPAVGALDSPNQGTNCMPAVRYSWNDARLAADTANTLNYRGYDDWRVPNAKELLSLVDDGCAVVAMNTEYFRQAQPDWHWTSSPAVGRAGKAWAVDFNFHPSRDDLEAGGAPWLKMSEKLFVRLVRGPGR